jgi:hypothetical protein
MIHSPDVVCICKASMNMLHFDKESARRTFAMCNILYVYMAGRLWRISHNLFVYTPAFILFAWSSQRALASEFPSKGDLFFNLFYTSAIEIPAQSERLKGLTLFLFSSLFSRRKDELKRLKWFELARVFICYQSKFVCQSYYMFFLILTLICCELILTITNASVKMLLLLSWRPIFITFALTIFINRLFDFRFLLHPQSISFYQCKTSGFKSLWWIEN